MIWSENPRIEVINGDCMEGMKEYPDKYFELAIVDPPYGIGASSPSKKPHRVRQKNGTWLTTPNNYYTSKDWDRESFSMKLFLDLNRVSKEQIIWGCNFYDFPLKGGRIIWDKINGETDQHDGEIAYCSIGYRVDIIRYMWRGMFQGECASKLIERANRQQGNKMLNEKRIHPTQKPVALYKWLLKNYAKEGDKILDTHMGSGSIAIACYDMGFSLTAYEIDKDYYEASHKRFNNHISQLQLKFE